MSKPTAKERTEDRLRVILDGQGAALDLARKLVEYAHHSEQCSIVGGKGWPRVECDCDCGLNGLLDALGDLP